MLLPPPRQRISPSWTTGRVSRPSLDRQREVNRLGARMGMWHWTHVVGNGEAKIAFGAWWAGWA